MRMARTCQCIFEVYLALFGGGLRVAKWARGYGFPHKRACILFSVDLSFLGKKEKERKTERIKTWWVPYTNLAKLRSLPNKRRRLPSCKTLQARSCATNRVARLFPSVRQLRCRRQRNQLISFLLVNFVRVMRAVEEEGGAVSFPS